MVVVGKAGVSIPDVEAGDQTNGKRDPETAIRAGNSGADCIAIGDIPSQSMRIHL